MKLHVHKFPDTQTHAVCREVPDNAPAPVAPWVEMTIAAFNTWKDSFVWSVAADPAFNAATQKLVPGPTTFNDTLRTAVRTKVVVALTAAELSLLDDGSEAPVLQAAYQTFRNGTGTSAQVQRAVAWLIKQEARRRGLIQ